MLNIRNSQLCIKLLKKCEIIVLNEKPQIRIEEIYQNLPTFYLLFFKLICTCFILLRILGETSERE